MVNTMKEVLASLDAIISNAEKALEKPVPTESAPNAPTSGKVVGADKKKAKKKKSAKPAAEPAPAPSVTQFLMCDFRVGLITKVGHHPESEKLFALSVSYGEGEPERSVCAGLRGFVEDAALENRLVVTIANLKPRSLAGVKSEAMILAGSVASGDKKEQVVPLCPPASAKAGDIVSAEGISLPRTVQAGAFVSSKNWSRVADRLCVKGGQATYDGAPLLVNNEAVVCGLPDGADIN